jgi:hypothetical protein
MSATPAELTALRTVAERLGPIREEVVFVGGYRSQSPHHGSGGTSRTPDE